MMEQTTSPLSKALSLVLQLSPKERIAASVDNELTAPSSVAQALSEHWGKSLNLLLDSLDMSDWESIDDPEDWLRRVGEAEQQDRMVSYTRI
jgi:hypothetical protein